MRQFIHEQSGDIPTMKSVPDGALKVISSVQENRIRPFIHELSDRRVDSGDSTHTSLLLLLAAETKGRTCLLEPSTQFFFLSRVTLRRSNEQRDRESRAKVRHRLIEGGQGSDYNVITLLSLTQRLLR